MRGLERIMCIAGAVLCACASGSDDPSTRPSGDSRWGDKLEGQRISVAVENEVITPGQPVKLTLTVENVVSDPVEVAVDGDALAQFRIKVIGPNDQECPLTRYGKSIGPPMARPPRRIVTLRQHEKSTWSLNVSRAFDMTLAGDYRIFATRTVRTRADPDITATLTSNTVVISIKEEPPKEE